MKKYFLFILVILINLLNYAQTISFSGNVKDVINNSPIENAKVQIKNLDTGIADSVFTDAIGNWQYNFVTAVYGNPDFIPNDLQVYQNFPNPFNPSTKIGFFIPTNENVTISVHNILGELIDEKSTFLSAGNYFVNWFSKGSAGVYFYTISYRNQSLTKK
jgi:hypothetical protein